MTASAGDIVYHGAALATGRGPELEHDITICVRDGIIVEIGPAEEWDAKMAADVWTVDARGAVVVPSMVDSHSHLTMPGGAHWVDRGADPAEVQLQVADDNAKLMLASGVRWARDVGAATRTDPVDGRTRALSLGIRDRWHGHRDFPYVRAAGTWLSHRGVEPLSEISVQAKDGDELLAAARRQLDDGADFLKLYLDGPDPDTAPFTVSEVQRVVDMAHESGSKVTAHATQIEAARAGILGGVDSIEHGWDLDADLVKELVTRGTVLVSTVAVLRSMMTFATTTRHPRFTGDAAGGVHELHERACASVKLAHDAGVAIAAGSDFGGGSLRANQLVWEIESLVAIGLEPWEALAAATWRGGDLLGEPDAGVIREGGPADFFLVHGDPLRDPSALGRVWKVS